MTNEEIAKGLEPMDMSQHQADSIVFEGDGDKTNYKKRYAVYAGHRIILFKSQTDTQERGIIDIKYARIKETKLLCGSKRFYGFVLMARGCRLFFYADTQQLQL